MKLSRNHLPSGIEFDISGVVGDPYAPVGFNASRETNGRLSIGECTEQGTYISGQVLDISGQKEPPGAPIIVSPGGHRSELER
jgi:hypothetical protein